MEKKKKFHFIGIGGSLMHNVAVALKELGHTVAGSDGEIVDPSRAKLLAHSLLPARAGWFPEGIDKSINGVIVGMHTKKDNPELIKAHQLGLKVYTVPEYIYEFAQNKQRIVVVGTYGRHVVASMLVHVLRFHKRHVDYLISKGNDYSVNLSNAPAIIIDGSEGPSSALYHTPQFIKYKHHIGIITEILQNGTSKSLSENDFIRQYDLFADATPKAGILIYSESDKIAGVICNKERADVLYVPYKGHPSATEAGKEYLVSNAKERIPAALPGRENMMYYSAALEASKKIGITQEQFYKAIADFSGIVA